jgi:hypothetical protein
MTEQKILKRWPRLYESNQLHGAHTDSSDANVSSVLQEIPKVLLNPKFNYRHLPLS